MRRLLVVLLALVVVPTATAAFSVTLNSTSPQTFAGITLSGVDQTNTERLLELFDVLASEGRTLLIATHDVDQTHAWDLVLCLNRRQVAFGPPEPTLTEDVLRATFPGAIVVHQHQGHEGPGPDGAA